MTQKTALSFAKATASRANKIPVSTGVFKNVSAASLLSDCMSSGGTFFLLVWTEIAGGEGKTGNTWQHLNTGHQFIDLLEKDTNSKQLLKTPFIASFQSC